MATDTPGVDSYLRRKRACSEDIRTAICFWGLRMENFSMCGRLAAASLKKRRQREKAEAKARLEEAVECRYTCLESRVEVVVLKAAYCYGASPTKGVTQR